MSVATDVIYDALDERTRDLLELRAASTTVRRRGWLIRRALLIADLAGLTIAFTAAQLIYGQGWGRGALSGTLEIAFFALSLPLWVIAAKVYGLYDRDEERTDHSTTDDFVGVFHLVTVCTFLLYALSRQTSAFNPEFGKLLLFWAMAFPLVTGGRAAARSYCRRQVTYVQNTIIVGAGEVGQNIARKLLTHREYGINLVGFVDGNPLERGAGLEHLTLLGVPGDLPQLVDLLDVERVIVAFSNDGHDDLLTAIRLLRGADVQVDIIPRLFDGLGPSVGLHTIEGIPVVGLPPLRLPRSSLVIKRILDVALATAGLICLMPLFAVVAALIKRDSPGPVFYRHERVGRDGKFFGLYKFRSMRAEACRGAAYGGEAAEEEFARLMADPARRDEFASSYKLHDDPRVTRVGRFLRRTSLDEFPQLINVLTGDLSLVGPRPLTTDELDRYYGEAASELLQTRPGVTGYWQVNGRSDLQYDDRVRLDMAYVTGWSLALDLAILSRTLRTVLTRRAAY